VTVADALMLALGVIAVGAGALVVTSTHLVRSGFYLVVSLGANAGLYLVLGAELVAWVQVLVYVGAVVVLLLFAVMLTRAPIGPSADLDRPAGPAALIGAGVGFGLTALLVDAFRWTRYELPPPGTARRVGEQLFGAWVLPFEVISILLLAALVGAIVLSRPDLGARCGPQPAGEPVPPPGPVDETDDVKARLERIAARQSAAQARVRQQAEADRAAGESAVATEEPPDRLKDRARDIVFGAGDRRPPLGEEPLAPESPDNRVIEGTSRPGPAQPAIEGTSRPAAPQEVGSTSRLRPAVDGPSAPPASDSPTSSLSRAFDVTSRPTNEASASPKNADKSEIVAREKLPALPSATPDDANTDERGGD
jgi:NADH:ubiquinone oxidoreductase subunit 6 (subunit J)